MLAAWTPNSYFPFLVLPLFGEAGDLPLGVSVECPALWVMTFFDVGLVELMLGSARLCFV
jgi:hypothetical protein